MSTQIQIHVRTEGMHDDMLQSEGVIVGPMMQLMSGKDYFEEFNDLIRDAPSVIVGNDRNDYPKRVAKAINNVQEVDQPLIDIIESIGDNYEYDQDSIDRVNEFLREHEGEEIFTIHW